MRIQRSGNETNISPALVQWLIEFVDSAVIVLDEALEIVFTNNRACQLLDRSQDQLYAAPLSQLYQYHGEFDHFLSRLSGEKPLNNCRATWVSGGNNHFVVTYSAISLEDRRMGNRQTILTFQRSADPDIHALEARLKKMEREFDDFLYVITHDLKAPLRAINNLSLWLQEDIAGLLTDETAGNFLILRSRVARMEAMIAGIADYAKVPKLKTAPEKVDVAVLLQEIIGKIKIPSHVQINFSVTLPGIITGKAALSRVLYELILNAVSYNDKEMGYVRISARDRNSYVEFTVEDNGPGIPQECQQKIFVIFQTLHSKDKIESAGMGLALAKRIVEEFDGQIQVESEYGRGTKFTFTWPIQNLCL